MRTGVERLELVRKRLGTGHEVCRLHELVEEAGVERGLGVELF